MEKNTLIFGEGLSHELDLSSSAIIQSTVVVNAFIEDPWEEILKKRKPNSRKRNNPSITPEQFEQLIRKEFTNSECLLCLRKKQAEMKSRWCPACESKCYKGSSYKFKLFMHMVKHHHPVGKVVNQNLNIKNICIFGCPIKESKEGEILFDHIITQHVCKWLKADHQSNHQNVPIPLPSNDECKVDEGADKEDVQESEETNESPSPKHTLNPNKKRTREKNRKIRNYLKLEPKEFKQEIEKKYRESKECLLCKVDQIKNAVKNNKEEYQCLNSACASSYAKKGDLRQHYIETHHLIGEIIYRYAQDARCDLLHENKKVKKSNFSSGSNASSHVITEHVIPWLEKLHEQEKLCSVH